MNEYERKEFKVRQIMTTFFSAQYLLVIIVLLQFMPQSYELRFELATPWGSSSLMILGICAALLLVMLGCCLHKTIFQVAEIINALLALLLGLFLSIYGIIIFIFWTWHFWVYLKVTNDALNKYRINHISDYEKAEAAYRNEHQGLFHNDEEEQ